jgi:hypothetical protein
MNLEMTCAKSVTTGLPVELLANSEGKIIPASAFDLPVYDTLVESSTTVMSAGGTLTFFSGGSEGTQVGQLTITIMGDGRRIIQRTA